MTAPKQKWPLQIIVGAKDATAAVFRKVDGALERLKGPLRKVNGLLRLSGVSAALGKVRDVSMRLGGSFVDMARKLSLVGSVGAAALGALVQRVTGAGDRTIKLARQIGVNVEALQEWRYAAESSGLSTDLLDKGVAKLTVRMAQARAGYGEANAAFRAMGIALVDAEGNARSVTDVFPEVADVIARVSDEGARMAIATPLFEEEGTALVRMLEGGSEGLRKMGEEARAAGKVTNEEQLRGFEAFQTTLARVKSELEGLTTQLVSALLPTIQRVADAFKDWLGENQGRFAEWMKDIRENLPGAIASARSAFQDLNREVVTMSAIVEPALRMLHSAFALTADSITKIVEGLIKIEGFLGFEGVRKSLGFGTLDSSEFDRRAERNREISRRARERRALEESGIREVGAPAAGSAAPAPASGEIKVSFLNAPPGLRVERDQAARRSMSLRVGYSMPEVGLA